MKNIALWTGIGSLVVSVTMLGQGRGNVPMPTSDRIPSSLMTFFVTSEPIGDGGNLGGLAGADAHCQMLATRAGLGGRTWRAYLSTQARPGQPAIHARDRIGAGPWYNAKERIPDYLGRRLQRPLIQSEIHGDTLDEAHRGSNLTKEFAVTENGELINGIGDPLPTRHDILTGSQPDGRAFTDAADHTCNNWTSGASGTAQLGHHDRTGGPNTSWNSVHPSRGCSQENLVSTGGGGLFYCFAVN